MIDLTGVIFDKDGTLFDFTSSWGAWTQNLLRELAGGDSTHMRRMGKAIGYDPDTGAFAANSPVVAQTPDALTAILLPYLPGQTAIGLARRMNLLAARAAMAEVVPLAPLTDELRERGLRLGLATNDSEAAARAHLSQFGLEPNFDFVAGFDSGFGAKPHPGMLLAFADAFRLHPRSVAMIGDSRHDLIAGRAAGMITIAVLSGPADRADLVPLADIVVPDIGALPALLDAPPKLARPDAAYRPRCRFTLR